MPSSPTSISEALASLNAALEEVSDLEKASPTGIGQAPRHPKVTKVVARAGIVLLCSHFERYFYAVNEEVVDFINREIGRISNLPPELKLLHSRIPIDEIGSSDWMNRSDKIIRFVASDGWLWHPTLTGVLDHARILSWMKSPNPKSLTRYYKYWGINDIFSEITRSSKIKGYLYLKLKSLVEKRNNIAHGDIIETATIRDVRSYASAVQEFCTRADKLLSNRILKTFRVGRPW